MGRDPAAIPVTPTRWRHGVTYSSSHSYEYTSASTWRIFGAARQASRPPAPCLLAARLGWRPPSFPARAGREQAGGIGGRSHGRVSSPADPSHPSSAVLAIASTCRDRAACLGPKRIFSPTTATSTLRGCANKRAIAGRREAFERAESGWGRVWFVLPGGMIFASLELSRSPSHKKPRADPPPGHRVVREL